MFGPGVREHNDVVHVDSSEFPHVLERHVHGPLESAGRVGQPKWHYQPLKRAPLGLEGRLVYVLWGHANLVEPRVKVHLREKPSPFHFVNRDIHPRSGIDILDGDRVQASVVDGEA